MEKNHNLSLVHTILVDNLAVKGSSCESVPCQMWRQSGGMTMNPSLTHKKSC